METITESQAYVNKQTAFLRQKNRELTKANLQLRNEIESRDETIGKLQTTVKDFKDETRFINLAKRNERQAQRIALLEEKNSKLLAQINTVKA